MDELFDVKRFVVDASGGGSDVSGGLYILLFAADASCEVAVEVVVAVVGPYKFLKASDVGELR